MAKQPTHLVVGHVSRAHGTRGEVYVQPLTDHPESVYAPGVVLRAAADDGEGPDPSGAPLRIGIAWAGNAANRINRRRSCPLEALAPLAAIEGVALYSLQVGPEAARLAAVPFGARLIDLSPGLADFRDTAAAVMALDLVVSIDSAVAHLAGALGRPVWVMLSKGGDWRYLEDRADSPWYPTMRLFRQPAPGDWPAVVEAVRAALEAPRVG